MGLVQESVHVFGAGGGSILPEVGGGIAAVGTVAKMVYKVPEGHRAYRTHYGQAKRSRDGGILRWRKAGNFYRVYGSGPHFGAPFMHNYVMVNTRNHNTPLEDNVVERREGQYLVRAAAVWAVKDDDESGYRSLYHIDSVDEKGNVDRTKLPDMVASICVSGLGEVMSRIKKSKLNDHKEIVGNVIDLRGDDLDYYGVELRQINPRTAARTVGQMLVTAGQTPNPSLQAIATALQETGAFAAGIPIQQEPFEGPKIAGVA